MTNEDWVEVKKSLSWTWASVKLDCDGYKLSICRERYRGMRDCLCVYVDGVWKGGWRTEDCEERRRFACHRKVYLRKPKERREMRAKQKQMSKSTLKYLRDTYPRLSDPDLSAVVYTPIWMNFSSIKAHLVKNNKEIRILKDEQGEQANG